MSANIPEFLESSFVLSGELDALAENLLDNLHQRRNWGISYVETYTNVDGFPVYLISGVQIRNKTNSQKGILGFTVKIIGIHKEQAEILVSSSYINTDGFPFRQISSMFNSVEITNEQEHSAQHIELLDRISEYCLNAYGAGLMPGDIFRKLLQTFTREKAKRH